MEKRALIAFALSVAVLLLWQWLVAPPPERPAVAPGPGPSVTAPSPEQPSPVPETAPEEEAPPTLDLAEPVVAAEPEEIAVETDLFRILLSNRGGRVVSWQLNRFTTQEGEPLVVSAQLPADESVFPLAVDLDDDRLEREINRALFVVERERLLGGAGLAPGERIRFRWADGRGVEVVKSLELRDGDYLAAVQVEVTDRGRRLPARLAWGPGFKTRRGESSGATYYYSSQAVWDLSGSVERERKIKGTISFGEPARLLWAGVEDQYFAAVIIPREPGGEGRVWPVEVTPGAERDDGEVPEAERRAAVSVTVPDGGVLLFVGPKNYRMLREMGHDLHKVVWFSSVSLFAWMATILYQTLIWLHETAVPNYGMAIILTTLLLRIVLFPLNQFSMVRMKKMQTEMQRIQPKVNAVKNKYKKKKDAEGRAQMNQELMALYKKEGVNPMGGMSGCLPLLIQFPILIGFYDMLLAAVELRGAPFFGWIQDLTLKDPYYVTPLLMGATMFLQQKMTMTKMGDPMQQRIMMMTPVIFTVMFLNLPSGLVLYWFVNNLLGIAQQWLVNRHIGRLEGARQKA